ncbi:MAG: BTAD domain-containing putative transcriptional regulator [Desertimonas sp.]
MQLAVLGPVELHREGRPVALGGIKQRTVLGILAARRRQVVPVDDLIDGLWPDGPPNSPRKTVQVYVTRLRRVFGDDAAAIGSEAIGYRYDPDVVPVDADAFSAGVQAARRAADADAATTLRDALGLWRGDAFVDLRDSPAILGSAVALDAERVQAHHELLEHGVRWSPHAVLSEIERAVEEHPLDEGYTGLLMTALYRVGRHPDALAVARGLRRRLGDELGLEPSPALRELEGRILRHELEPGAPPPPPQATRHRRRVTAVAVGFHLGDEIDLEDEAALVGPLRRAARAAIVSRGGVVLADVGDGILASFGYPAVEGAAGRAIDAALELRDGAGDRHDAVDVVAAVASGSVVVEDHVPGQPSAMTGAPVRAAVRGRALALPGDVLVADSTRDALEAGAELVGSVRDDGFLAVRALRRATGQAPLLVGRTTARAELRAATADAGHRLCTVVVAGPPGIGASALARAYLADDPDASAGRVLFVEGARGVVGVAGLDWPGCDTAGEVPTARVLAATLDERWDGEPGVLVLDALDAMGDGVVELVDELPDHVPAGVLLLTTRHAGAVELDEPVPIIELGPLDPAHTRDLVRRQVGGRLPADVLNVIVERSGGVPGHALALAAAALAGGNAAAEGVPASVYDAAMGTIDALGERRWVAQRCAVLGHFDDDELEVVCTAETLEAARIAVADFERTGLLIRHDDGRHRFLSDLVAQAAYDSVLRDERRSLHGRLADHLVAIGADPARLAAHLDAADRPTEAVIAWCRASDQAASRSRFDRSARAARRALRSAERATAGGADVERQRRRALTSLAIALQTIRHGSLELAEVLEEIRAMDAPHPPTAGPLETLLMTIDVSNRQALGDFEGAEAAARSGLAATPETDVASRAVGLSFLGATLVWRGRLAEGETTLASAQEHWERTPNPLPLMCRARAASLTMLALSEVAQGRPAGSLLQRAAAAVDADDRYGRLLVEIMKVVVAQLAGASTFERPRLDRLWAEAMELGADFWATWAQALVGWATAASDADAGLSMIEEVIDTTTTRQMVPYFHLLAANRRREVGDSAGALRNLDHGIAVAAATGERLWEPMLRAALDGSVASGRR